MGICVKSKTVLPKIYKLKQNKKKNWAWEEEKTAYVQNEQRQPELKLESEKNWTWKGEKTAYAQTGQVRLATSRYN